MLFSKRITAIISGLLFLLTSSTALAFTPFSPGVVLSATALNAALNSATITSGTIAGVTGFGIRSSGGGALYDLQIQDTETLTANRAITLTVGDTARSIAVGGNLNFGSGVTTIGTLTTAGAFTTSGAFPLTLTTSASTNVTLPVTGTLSTLANVETLTNKTLTNPAFTVQSLADAGPVTWNMANGNYATLLLSSSSRTISNPTNIPTGGHASLRITQGGSGSYVPTFSSSYKWAGGTQPTFSTAVGKIDMVNCNIVDGANLICNALLDVR